MIKSKYKIVKEAKCLIQVWVSPSGDNWKVKSTGASKAAAITETKAEAKEIATRIAQNQGAELVVQRQDGTIQEKNSFGNDPFPPKG